MDEPTVDRKMETKFFKRHNKHLSAILNLGEPKDEEKEDKEKKIAEELLRKLE